MSPSSLTSPTRMIRRCSLISRRWFDWKRSVEDFVQVKNSECNVVCNLLFEAELSCGFRESDKALKTRNGLSCIVKILSFTCCLVCDSGKHNRTTYDLEVEWCFSVLPMRGNQRTIFVNSECTESSRMRTRKNSIDCMLASASGGGSAPGAGCHAPDGGAKV